MSILFRTIVQRKTGFEHLQALLWCVNYGKTKRKLQERDFSQKGRTVHSKLADQCKRVAQPEGDGGVDSGSHLFRQGEVGCGQVLIHTSGMP